jgi:hypothetical protein
MCIFLGSLVMSQNEAESSPVLSTMLFGTINGVIGVVANITQEAFQLLEKVQYNITKIVRGVGGLDHSEYVCNNYHVKPYLILTLSLQMAKLQ